ncbi:MAG TPA: hypothetical protein ENG03_00970 [Thioploca sp.]|nr:MAG: hypothetical protein B6247_26260 [Beggiatoa sp. 4572_84]RKZ58633.1 MAG: hypothetical protein DRR08_15965 [Gammaproteobacteria bacterium]HDN25672.1 hypothetical protein [Thioploca sp.]
MVDELLLFFDGFNQYGGEFAVGGFLAVGVGGQINAGILNQSLITVIVNLFHRHLGPILTRFFGKGRVVGFVIRAITSLLHTTNLTGLRR